jgi:hypothetical protein
MSENLKTGPIHSAPLGARMFHGGVIALVLIIIFLLGVDEPNPEWPTFWMVKPLIIVPLAGAMGGVFYYFMDLLRYEGGWKKTLAILLSLVGYLVALWMGTVLGLNGTLWD